MAERLSNSGYFGGSGSIPSTGYRRVNQAVKYFAPTFLPDAALNGCKLHVKPDFNFFNF